MAAATVTAAQGYYYPAAAAKVGAVAKVGANGVIAGGKLAAKCVGDVCTVVANEASKVANKVVGRPRSIDGPVLSDRAVNDPDKDTLLASRYGGPEPESDKDDLE